MRIPAVPAAWRQWLHEHGEWLLLPLGLIVVALTAADYGIAWDEKVQIVYGDLAWRFFASGGQDREVLTFLDLWQYGALFELLSVAVQRCLPGDLFTLRHGLSAVTGVLAVVAAARFARGLGGAAAAAIAGVALALLPQFYGHAFINSKDIPFACGFAWAMVGLARWLREDEPPAWRWALAAGVAIGLALAVRIGGLLLFAFMGAAVVARLAAAWQPGGGAAWWRLCRRLAGQGVAVAAVAWAVMVAAWPYALQSPLRHPVAAFFSANRFHQTYEVLFAGEYLTSTTLPRSYLPHLLAITVPPLVLLLAVVGAARLGVWGGRARQQAPLARLTLALLWVCFPLAYVMATRPSLYDGLRHFLFVMPGLAALAGVGGAWVLARVPAGRPRLAVAVLGGLLLVSPVVSLVRLHPYQMAYFNLLVGGPRGADGRYDAEYWATSYREAMAWIARQPPRADGQPLLVMVAGNSYNELCARYYCPPGVDLQVIPPQTAQPLPTPDYYVSLTRYRVDPFAALPVVHTIGRAGARYAYLRSGRTDPPGRMPLP